MRPNSGYARRKVSVRFGGVYRDSTVWINGARLGTRPCGYISFEYDLTPHLRFGAPNVLAVRVDHSVIADSRWYPGSGIHRHVWLNITGPVHIAAWGTFVTTPVAGAEQALVSVETRVMNETQAEVPATVVTSIVNARGEEVAAAKSEEPIAAGKDRNFAQQAAVPRPSLWSPEQPYLYKAISRIYRNGNLIDEQETPFGIRTFYFSPDRGLILNGRPTKMKGVCIHHDLGALGAAFFEEALERRLRSFQEIGVNAIRASHNPMAPEFYDLCDRLGFLVQDEAFDEWTGGKRKWAEGRNNGAVARRGYNEAFEEWGERDASGMVQRSRNHPSIIMWSIGNEIDYPDDPFVHPRGRVDSAIPVDPGKKASPSANVMPAIARRLIAAVKRFDTTRPVTMALAEINTSNATGVANMLDVVGYNYLEQHYARDHKLYPGRVIYGCENGRGLEQWRPQPVERWGFPNDARKTVPVEIISNCQSVELFLNGRSLGEKAISDPLAPTLSWEVPNEPGTLEAAGRKGGAIAARFLLETAGQPARIELVPDLKRLENGGRQVSTIEVYVSDRDGNRTPDAADSVTFEVAGPRRRSPPPMRI